MRLLTYAGDIPKAVAAPANEPELAVSTNTRISSSGGSLFTKCVLKVYICAVGLRYVFIVLSFPRSSFDAGTG